MYEPRFGRSEGLTVPLNGLGGSALAYSPILQYAVARLSRLVAVSGSSGPCTRLPMADSH